METRSTSCNGHLDHDCHDFNQRVNPPITTKAQSNHFTLHKMESRSHFEVSIIVGEFPPSHLDQSSYTWWKPSSYQHSISIAESFLSKEPMHERSIYGHGQLGQISHFRNGHDSVSLLLGGFNPAKKHGSNKSISITYRIFTKRDSLCEKLAIHWTWLVHSFEVTIGNHQVIVDIPKQKNQPQNFPMVTNHQPAIVSYPHS